MVGLHGDHNGVRPCSGRLAYRTWLVALGILPERSTGRRCLGDFALARPGKPRRKRSPDRLDWHISGHLRTWWCGHGISGICQARLVEFFGGRKLDRWRGLLDSFRSGRTSHCFATGAPGALQVALFSRRKLAHAGVVRCDRYLFLSVSDESNSPARLFCDRRWCRSVADDFADVFSVALVRKP